MSIADWTDEELHSNAGVLGNYTAYANYITALRAELHAYQQQRAMVSKEAYVPNTATAAEWEQQVRAHERQRIATDPRHTGDALDAYVSSLLAKERGMVACLHNALYALTKWSQKYASSTTYQWDLANKVLADGAAMAETHDEAIRIMLLEQVKTIVATQPNAPDTKVGRRQQWVRAEIIEKLRALESVTM